MTVLQYTSMVYEVSYITDRLCGSHRERLCFCSTFARNICMVSSRRHLMEACTQNEMLLVGNSVLRFPFLFLTCQDVRSCCSSLISETCCLSSLYLAFCFLSCVSELSVQFRFVLTFQFSVNFVVFLVLVNISSNCGVKGEGSGSGAMPCFGGKGI